MLTVTRGTVNNDELSLTGRYGAAYDGGRSHPERPMNTATIPFFPSPHTMPATEFQPLFGTAPGSVDS